MLGKVKAIQLKKIIERPQGHYDRIYIIRYDLKTLYKKIIERPQGHYDSLADNCDGICYVLRKSSNARKGITTSVDKFHSTMNDMFKKIIERPQGHYDQRRKCAYKERQIRRKSSNARKGITTLYSTSFKHSAHRTQENHRTPARALRL